MRGKRTRHPLGAWVRGTALAVLIVGAVGLAGLAPKVLEAEHRWMVARCPIAYVGEDGRIHLTNEAGTLDVELEGPAADTFTRASLQNLYYFSPRPAWSPNGELIAYVQFESIPPNSYESKLVVLEPAARRIWRPVISTNTGFGGWVRDETLISGSEFIDVRTGAVVPKPEWADMGTVSPVPLRGGGGWIAGGGSGLHFRTEDFRVRMPIWSSYGNAAGPRVDPSGAWAAWTSDAGVRSGIRIKLIEETVAKPARSIWPSFEGSVFCDWTGDGDVFANVSERGKWGLVILDKQGTVLRRIVTDVRPMVESGASWRRRPGEGER